MKESSKAKERRRYPRFGVNYPASCINSEDGIQQQTAAMGQVLDISRGGVKMEVDTVVRVGADIVVRLTIENSTLVVVGKVVRSSPAANGKQIVGIELDEPIKNLCIEA